MGEESLQDRIEKYLLGELSPIESEQIETDMGTNPELAERVEVQRLGLMGLQRLAAKDLIEKFEQWDNDLDDPIPPTTLPSTKPTYILWAWATAILLLVISTIAFWHFFQMEKMQQIQDSKNKEILQRDSSLLAIHHEFQRLQDSLATWMGQPRDSISAKEIKRLQDELDDKDKLLHDLESQQRVGKPEIALQFAGPRNETTRGPQKRNDPTLAKEETAFEAGNFSESLRLLKSIQMDDDRQELVKKRLPYALFYAKDYEAAIPAFLHILETDQFEEANAQWFLLLCYVATGQESEIRLMLHVILNSKNSKYHQKAIDLKKELKL